MGSLYIKLARKLSIKSKISWLVFVASIISSLAVFVITTSTAKRELTAASKNQLSSLATIAKSRISEYFDNSKEFAQALGEDRLIEGLFLAYEGAFFGAGNDVGEDVEIIGGTFDKLDALYGPRMKKLLKNYGFENILLINLDGQVVFSGKSDPKSLFLGKNVEAGSLGESSLGKCFLDSKDRKDKKINFYDFQYYPHVNKAKAFLCVKAYAEFDHLSEGIHKGDDMGIVVAELDLSIMNTILGQRAGMGETGQSYVVGPDQMLRSDFYLESDKFNIHSSLEKSLKLNSLGVTKALAGDSGFIFTLGSLGEEVAMEFKSIDVYGNKWAIISEKSEREIFASIKEMIIKALFGMLIIVGVVLVAAQYLANAFASPLVKVGRKLGEAAELLNQSSGSLQTSAEKLSEQASQQSAVVEETKAGLSRIMEGSERNLEGAAKSQEISEHVSGETSSAHKQMQNLVSAMSGIKGSFEEIDEMVDVIKEVGAKTQVMNSIAYKTQILSFNASIEAARAGSAGRGFAVVAQEVGQLADMSSKAATEIEDAIKKTVQKVEELTSGSKDNVTRGEELVSETSTMLDRVVDSTEEVKQSSVNIFNSSNEQTSGVSEINLAVEQILTAVTEGEREAISAKERSGDLARQSEALSEISKNMVRVIYGEGNSLEESISKRSKPKGIVSKIRAVLKK